jgi:formylglycine-generating enzyme required for sulfatase activity
MRFIVCGLVVVCLALTGCSGSENAAEDQEEETSESRREYTGPRGWEGSNARQPGQSVQTPFEDPASGGGPGPRAQRYERPYERSTLKNTDPLVVPRSGPPPFDDPGVPPISGTPMLANGEEQVRLPAGSFIMGLTDADPFDIQTAGRKHVSVSQFYIDRFEVTNADYRAYLDTLSSDRRAAALPDSTLYQSGDVKVGWSQYFYASTYENHPVVGVTWKQASDYCARNGQRLPTEAEWEYAARGGIVGGVYPWEGFSVQNSDGSFLANYDPGRMGQDRDGYAFTAPVGSFPPNDWGLHDMSGNVAEWVMDAYTARYNDLSDFNPVHKDPDEKNHIVRGGSWASNAFRLGVGFRDFQDQAEPSLRVGFRCANDQAGTGRSAPRQSRSGQS